ncbi:hypothetical protein QNH20_02805 [Neobacillus sp. WH10]|uniref:anti-sigma factor family protein n=1 Tax=Neobacillus sp. WH10 TaxID=3047873 RepID=UPI0024C16F77|nr:hypothetical protein [Neobacillus sp. WH10]WHY78110.1 hypothetical protein QNH20_02805 [Neobacillus sp. WH10]
MKHYTYDEWQQYVKNEINENTREELESHLYTCDQCLEAYLQAVSANESSLPVLSSESNFTDQVMAMVMPSTVPHTVTDISTVPAVPSVPDTEDVDTEDDTKDNTQKFSEIKKKRFYQQAVFHYILAAAATILLMFTGAFQSLVSYANSLESPLNIQEKKPSVTEGVINKTFAWMDSLEKKEADKK